MKKSVAEKEFSLPQTKCCHLGFFVAIIALPKIVTI